MLVDIYKTAILYTYQQMMHFGESTQGRAYTVNGKGQGVLRNRGALVYKSKVQIGRMVKGA